MSTPAPSASAAPERGRPSDEGRFLWLSCLSVERIVNELGQTQAAFGIAVYVALCRLSSRDKNNPRVAATVSKIAGMARLGYRKAFDILGALESQAKVITIERSERAQGAVNQPPNTYVLLSGRLRGKQSGRLHGRKSADCTGRTPSRADNPIEYPIRGILKGNKEIPASPDAASAGPQGQRGALDAGRNEPCTGRF